MVRPGRSSKVEQACLTAGKICLETLIIALAPYVVAVTIETRTRGEMLTSRSQLLGTLGRGYARVIRYVTLWGSIGHYALGHLDVISDSLHGRRRIHPNSFTLVNTVKILIIMQIDTPLCFEFIPVPPPRGETFTVRDRMMTATSANMLN
jgi:hypothetical protein